MPPAPDPSKQTNSKTDVPNNTEEHENVEKTELAVPITVPTEGGWGWVVVAASFICIFIVDGIFFTFGSLIHDIVEDLEIEESLVALINSLAVAMYFFTGPIVSALINRFGFRACNMGGSVVCFIGYLCSYFAFNYVTLLVFYGIIAGFGGCLVSVSSGLVVGFYFERLRALALAISGTGSSVGIMVIFSVNTYLVRLAGWRITTLFHSGFLGLIYFLSMTYRPLLQLTVTKTTEPTATTSPIGIRSAKHRNAIERLFKAASNPRFPTAAKVIEEGVVAPQTQAGPSKATGSKLSLTAHGPQSENDRKQLQQIQATISKTSVQHKDIVRNVEFNLEQPKKRHWWEKLCHWEAHVHQSRPMYRDDAFYKGRLSQLPEYQKTVLATVPEERTGLEYQMAVSRAVTPEDLSEKRGVFSTAVRRILATMMDPKLLKRISFLLLCTSGFFTYLGFLVPYVFLPDRNKGEGIDPSHCSLFISVIGFSNTVGRLAVGVLACKYCPVTLYCIACLISGVGIILFNISFNLYYQYACCVIFGLHISSLSSIRSVVIVKLFGLDMLTNATGLMILFQGVGSLISTPLSSVIKTKFGYAVSFYVAGAFLLMSGLVLLPIKRINAREKSKLDASKKGELYKNPVTIQNK